MSIVAAATVLPALAWTPPMPQAPNPVNGPGGTPGQTGTQAPSGKQTDDQITKVRKQLSDEKPGRRARSLSLDPVAQRTVDPNSPLTFKVVARDASLVSGLNLSYSLVGAPEGASINSDTGVFSWTPTVSGTFSFIAMVKDDSDPPRTATVSITIKVSPPLTQFGYSFFAGARALIDYRLAVVRSGLMPGFATAAGNAQAAAGLPVITQGSVPGFGAAGTNALKPIPGETDGRGNYVTPPGNAQASSNQTSPSNSGGANGTGSNGPGNSNGMGTTNGTGNANGTGNTNNPGNTNGAGNASGKASSTVGSTAAPSTANSSGGSVAASWTPQTSAPVGLIPPPGSTYPGDNSASADALRYFVGPFDMLGLNVFVPAPERYQLGPGDILSIRYWSPAVEETEVEVKVDGQGAVSVPVGNRKIVIRGQTLQQAEQLLKHELRLDLKNAQLSVTLKALRTMSITVLGDAYLPGSYQVPAVATLFNALYMFGGPSNTGSLRGIELRRSDGTVRNFDLYRFLVYGDSKQDVPLQPGDTIWIPPAGARVTVEGEVLRPGIYEAAKGERLRSLIMFAGGPRATGVVQRVSLETVEPAVGRQLRDVDLNATGTPESDPPIFDGDVATVFSVRELYTNAISLEGAVDQPGQYAATAGTSVADLIARARGLLPEAYTARADLFRRNPDKSETLIPINLDRALARTPEANLALRPFDRLVVYTVNDVQWMGDRRVTIAGAVQRPGPYYRADNMRILDLLLQAGGLSPDAYTQELFLQRTEPNGVLGPLVKLDFARIAANDPTMNLPLQDRDVLTVQSITEAKFTPDARVRILGSVQAPGPYPRGSNMHLSDLIKLAGNILPDASDFVEIADARVPLAAPRRHARVSAALSGADDPLLLDGDLVTIPGRSDIQLAPRKVVIMGQVRNPGPYPIDGRTDRLSDLITRAGGFAPNSYPDGAQFFRDPKLLATPSQDRLTPMIQRAVQLVNRESYLRELAKSQVDKARAFKGVNSQPSFALPGLGASVADNGAPVPDTLFQMQTVSPARPLTDEDLEPGGNINIDLPKALRHPKSSDNLVLEDGDIVVIPPRPTTVSVVGAVTVPSAVLFAPGRNLSYYINRSGGFLNDAATDHILVIRYKGQVVRPISSTVVEVGDIIWVPTKVIAARLTDRTSEIDEVTKTILSGAFLFALLRAL